MPMEVVTETDLLLVFAKENAVVYKATVGRKERVRNFV
jgi:hypothetical protein